MNTDTRLPNPFTDSDIVKMTAVARGWKIMSADGRQVAIVMLTPTGEVEYIGVSVEWQRRGIASMLWRYLVRTGENPRHSADRTTEGDLWSMSVGGRRPRRAYAY